MIGDPQQLVVMLVLRLSHYMTNYHKSRGLTVISGVTFQSVYVEKEWVEQRVNGFLPVISDEWAYAWDLSWKVDGCL